MIQLKLLKDNPFFLLNKRFENILHKGRYVKSQVCEKVLHILNHQGDANQNYNKLLPHVRQDSQEMKRSDSSKC